MTTEGLERDYRGVRAPATGLYTLDPSHTTIGFVAKHMMFTKVRGHFSDFDGRIVVGETPEESSLEVTVQVASLATGADQRDEHLRSADFFDVERFPTMTFTSKGVEWTGGTTFRVLGDLTVRGVTRPLALEATYEGSTPDPWGGRRAAFSAAAEIDREEWGLTWNVALETGGVLVSKKVVLEIETEVVLQQRSEEDLRKAS